MSDEPLTEFSAEFAASLLSRVVAWITWPIRPSPLDLVKESNTEPYLMTRHVFRAGTGEPLDCRWYRVGVLNRSRSTIEDVQVETIRLTPPELPGLPALLHLMHDNPPNPAGPYQQSLSVPPDKTPSVYVDVVAKVMNQPQFQLQHITPGGVRQQFPEGQYLLVLRVRGRGVKSRTRAFVLDLDALGELRFERSR